MVGSAEISAELTTPSAPSAHPPLLFKECYAHLPDTFRIRDRIRRRLRKTDQYYLSALYKTVSLAPFLEEPARIAQARNVFGCHFNELSFDLLDADAIGFGHQVLELMDVLTDDEAGWPRNDKSGEYWATRGETRRLYPLRKPS